MSYQRQYTRDWVTLHEDNWRKLLGHLAGQPQLQFLEIGSHEGRSACWWLENILTHPTARLTCIDPWIWEAPYHEKRFDANVADAGGDGKVRKWKADSRIALTRASFQAYDFIYVDGCHEACDVLLDGLMCLALVKPGGIILFDDYELDRNIMPQCGRLPREGIEAFLDFAGDQVELLFRDYQLAVRRSDLKP